MTSAWHLYPIRVESHRLTLTRAEFIEELAKRGIACSVHFIPLHLMTYYRDRYDYQEHDFEVAFDEFQKLVSLPLNSQMSNGDVEAVIDAVSDVVGSHRR